MTILPHLVSTLHYTIALSAIVFCWYFFIYQKQQHQQDFCNLIETKLQPGAFVKTIDNKTGTVLFVLDHSVVLSCHDGKKIEILKQTISHINETLS